MYGIGAGCPGANVLGHHRMGRLTLEHRLNHPRPKEIVTFLSSTSYTAPVGALYADVIVVGNGGAGSKGDDGVMLGGMPSTPRYGGAGGTGGSWGTQLDMKLVSAQYTVVVGTSSAFQFVTTTSAGPAGGAGGGSWYLRTSDGNGYYQSGTAGTNGVNTNRTLFTGVSVCMSGGGGGGSGFSGGGDPPQLAGFGGGTPYGGSGGRGTKNGSDGLPFYPGQNGSSASAGSGGGGGGGGCGFFPNISGHTYATAGGQGGAGGTGVVQIRFRREF